MPKRDRSHYVVKVFQSRAQADAADRLETARLTPGEKLALVETLRQQAYELIPAYRNQPRLPRHAWPVVKFVRPAVPAQRSSPRKKRR